MPLIPPNVSVSIQMLPPSDWELPGQDEQEQAPRCLLQPEAVTPRSCLCHRGEGVPCPNIGPQETAVLPVQMILYGTNGLQPPGMAQPCLTV